MFVINANDPKNTTNYMLADPWYPDLDSILMWGCPMADFSSLISIVWGTAANPFIFTPSDIAVVDTVNTYPINMYCPRINKESLYSWNSVRTPLWWITDYRQYRPDIWLRDKNLKSTSSTNKTTQKFQFWYNIAVKWLTAWQVVWEKIYTPIMLWWQYSVNTSYLWNSYWYVGYSSDAAYYANPIEINFKLLHQDWTTTSIATTVPTRLFGLYRTDTDPLTVQISSDWATSSMSIETIWASISNSTFGFTAFEWSYDWTWQVAQAWDMLVAEIRLNLALKTGGTNSDNNCAVWVYWGWTNNNNMRDVYWFRPFQVSIR